MSLKSSFKGLLGETVINVAVWLKLEKNVYHRLNDIILPRAKNALQKKAHAKDNPLMGARSFQSAEV